MNINWKIPAIAAGAAFVISFFSGVIGQVLFRIILVRALVSVLIVGVIAYLVEIIVRKVFIEDESDSDDQDNQTGASVDITIDDESAADYSNEPSTGGMNQDGEEAEAGEFGTSLEPKETLESETKDFNPTNLENLSFFFFVI